MCLILTLKIFTSVVLLCARFRLANSSYANKRTNIGIYDFSKHFA